MLRDPRSPLIVRVFVVAVAVAAGAGFAEAAKTTDALLEPKLREAAVVPLAPAPEQDANKVALGRLLFFDKELSGNRDVACSTCHHPLLATVDGLSVSIGTGGSGLGPSRQKDADRPFVARNAGDLFNRGAIEWTSQYWDSRVAGSPASGLTTPAGAALPAGLDSLLAAQAMFEVAGRDEMRGATTDVVDVLGNANELSQIADGDFPALWAALIDRLLAIEEYRELFAAAYPETPTEELGFAHAANAIAAYETEAFASVDTPFDTYLAGDLNALSEDQKRGALVFFGKATCGRCHRGALLSDQQHYNLAIPQIGSGKLPEAPLDFGRARETGAFEDQFAFRTPPLRNVAATGPWMHDGAYTTLEGAMRHHLNVVRSLLDYDPSQLAPELQSLVHTEPANLKLLRRNLKKPVIRPVKQMKVTEVANLMLFLETALTSPTLGELADDVPASVPSGLPVDGAP